MNEINRGLSPVQSTVHRLSHFALLCWLLTLGACTHIAPQERRQHADTLAAAHGWQPLRLPAGNFTLAAYVPAKIAASDMLTIYIEGDGLAWLTRSQASDDPTPRNPVGLQLALRHPHGAAAYLARPCQYVEMQEAQGCEQAYWTERRFAPEVVSASNRAIDLLKQRTGASKLTLVGYSGGGAVAALVAAKRQDVTRLITVAGNLDHRAWTAFHQVPPLHGSLNPADAWAALQFIQQLHFVGGKDEIINAGVVESYLARFPSRHRPEMQIIPGFDHACCWAEQWQDILTKANKK